MGKSKPSYGEWHWSPAKCLAVAVSVALIISAVVVPICVAAVTANRNADNHRLHVVQACVESGQSWIAGNCIRGAVVKP